MDVKYAERLVREIREEWHRPITGKARKDIIVQRAIECWAFDEIYIFLLSYEDRDTMSAMEQMLAFGEDGAAKAKNADTNMIFNTLCDICNEIMDVMRLMEDVDATVKFD